ncbi:hypothetical protein M951_chr3165 (nucleomorph) [Lotharella oceanica]|uniref:Uncharacterized protein n=1 Tax=Lotharella oceanica TaxID=641309 RepID=A0A060D9X2_9EUKA|nr:hypothetical protein M951_chr140 [Lotharella oceanica]AIB09670.1 hypothetical protein M951_chr1191 [Lotharella oceanica]AIB09743.1 hypothetical protein M951_chr240 [Lotharella oceanica]AIB09873.1 hypothetical protein M951_chr2181 [Lotharella oceanica]AIB09946.1 hypothetical protein M951_chr340 [Lotharella oceanica]
MQLGEDPVLKYEKRSGVSWGDFTKETGTEPIETAYRMVKNCILIPEIARTLICPTAITEAYLKGQAYALWKSGEHKYEKKDYTTRCRRGQRSDFNFTNYHKKPEGDGVATPVSNRDMTVTVTTQMNTFSTGANDFNGDFFAFYLQKLATPPSHCGEADTVHQKFDDLSNQVLASWAQQLYDRACIQFSLNYKVAKTLKDEKTLATDVIIGTAREQKKFIKRFLPDVDPYSLLTQSELHRLMGVYVESIEDGCMAMSSVGNGTSGKVVVP